MAKQDPKPMAKYAEVQGLLDLPQWRRLKRHSRRKKVCYMRAVTALAGIKKTAAKFKFGVQIPNNFYHCIKLDKENNNEEWQQAVKTEMDKIHEYKVFKDCGNKKTPPDYKKIIVHLVFDVKYDGRKRARLVGGGHLTMKVEDTPYSGIASLKNIRICIFIAQLNVLQTLKVLIWRHTLKRSCISLQDLNLVNFKDILC